MMLYYVWILIFGVGAYAGQTRDARAVALFMAVILTLLRVIA